MFWDYKKRSYLFTPVSQSDDFLSQEFRRLLNHKNEEWLIDDGFVNMNESQAPVTTLLVQDDTSFATMFTYPGILTSFSWKHVQPKLTEILKNGGVLYLSGFLKTNLNSQLRDNLSKLHRNTLICLDHGRLNPSLDSPKSVKVLHDIFGDGFVDLYICTFNGLLNFWRVAKGKKYNSSTDYMRETIEEIAATEKLPPITIIRSSIGERSIAAYAITGNSVDPIIFKKRGWLMDTPVAPQNSFNLD